MGSASSCGGPGHRRHDRRPWRRSPRRIDARTIGIIGSACNYGYGTIDPIAEPWPVGLERDVPPHVDGCLRLHPPSASSLGTTPPFDSASRCHQHLGGHPQVRLRSRAPPLLFRDKAYRNAQYFQLVGWSGGKYMSPSIAGSPVRWPARRHVGGDGRVRPRGLPRARAAIFSTAERMKRGDGRTRSCGSSGRRRSASASPLTRSTSTTSPTSCGTRLALQRPAVPERCHMAVTGPRPTRAGRGSSRPTSPRSVPYAVEKAATGAEALSAIYGGVAGGLTDEVADFRVGDHDRHAGHPAVLPPAP